MKSITILRWVTTVFVTVAAVSPALAQKVKNVTISPQNLELTMGDVEHVTTKITPSNAKIQEVWYTSSDLDVARVSSAGRIRAVGPGTATIKVISKDGYKKDTMDVVVRLPPPKPEGTVISQPDIVKTTGVIMKPSNVTVAVGSKEYVSGKVQPSHATDQGVWFKSSNPAVATIDSFGVVRGVSEGDAILTVLTDEGRITSTGKVTVVAEKYAVNGVTISPAVIRAAVGDKKYVTGTVTPSTALNTGVWFKSSDESVATVTSFGVVTAVGEGIALITVHAADGGHTATSRITVRAN